MMAVALACLHASVCVPLFDFATKVTCSKTYNGHLAHLMRVLLHAMSCLHIVCMLQQEAVTLLEAVDGDGTVRDVAEEEGGESDEIEAEQAARALLGLPNAAAGAHQGILHTASPCATHLHACTSCLTSLPNPAGALLC